MTSAWILATGVGIVLLLPLARRALAGCFDPFEPIVIFAVAYGVVFVARPMSMLARGELSYFGIDLRPTLALALQIALLGVVAFGVGYELLGGRTLGRWLPAPREIGSREGAIGAAALIAIALTALLVTVWPVRGLDRLTVLFGGHTPDAQGLISAAGAYVFNTAMLLVPAALLLLALALRHRSLALGAGATATLAFTLALLVPLGARTFLLPLLGGVLVLAYVTRGARPRLRTLALLGVVALVGSYVLTVVRTPSQRAEIGPTLRHLAERPDTPFRFATEGADSEMVPVLAAALQVIPSRLGYRYGGAVIGDLATRPIPRDLWPGKPEPGTERLVGALWPNLVKQFNPAFSSLLFFYWDFGLAGIAVGMAVVGVACRTLYEWFKMHADILPAQVIFAIALWLVVPAVRNTPVDTMVLAAFVVVPIVIVDRVEALRRLASRRGSRGSC